MSKLESGPEKQDDLEKRRVGNYVYISVHERELYSFEMDESIPFVGSLTMDEINCIGSGDNQNIVNPKLRTHVEQGLDFKGTLIQGEITDERRKKIDEGGYNPSMMYFAGGHVLFFVSEDRFLTIRSERAEQERKREEGRIERQKREVQEQAAALERFLESSKERCAQDTRRRVQTTFEARSDRLISPNEILDNPRLILDLTPRQLTSLLKEFEAMNALEMFLNLAIDDHTLIAQLSYWEKWLDKKHQKLLEKKLKERRSEDGFLPLALEKRFSTRDLKAIFSNLGAAQLTYGCSYGCKLCSFDAVPKSRESIPFNQLENLFACFGKELKRPSTFLYWASDPHDYRDGDKEYPDVHQLAVDHAGYNPHITTRELKDGQWFDFMTGQSENNRISLRREVDSAKKAEMFGGRKLNVLNSPFVKGIGTSFDPEKKDSEVDRGSGCFNGCLLSPRGLYNIVQVGISEEYPQGQYVIPIDTLASDRIEPGQRLKDVLRRSVVYYQNVQQERDNGKTIPFLTLITAEGIFDVAVDENGVVQQVEPSVMPYIERKGAIRDRLSERSEELYQLINPMRERLYEEARDSLSKTTTKAERDKIYEDIDIQVKEAYSDEIRTRGNLRKDEENLTKSIESALTRQLRKLGPQHRLQGYFISSKDFKKKLLRLGGETLRLVRLSADGPLRFVVTEPSEHYAFESIGIRFYSHMFWTVSEPVEEAELWIKEGDELSAKELFEKMPDLCFRLDLGEKQEIY